MTWLYVTLALLVAVPAWVLLSMLVVGIFYGPIIDSSHCRPNGDNQP